VPSLHPRSLYGPPERLPVETRFENGDDKERVLASFRPGAC